MDERVVARLKLLAAALLFSTGGAAIKAATLDSWQVAGFRSGVAALTIAAIVPVARRGWNARVAMVGLAFAATMIGFVVANKLTTAANSIFLQSTAPFYILLASPWLLRERVRGRDVLLMAVVGVGLLPFLLGTEAASATAPDPLRGNLVAMACGVSWACTVMGVRWLASSSSSGGGAHATVVVGNLMACAVCLPLALPVETATMGDWTVIVYLGVFQIGVAYLFLLSAVRHVPALEASIILLAEPALTPLWAWLMHGERPGGWALIGGGVILTATFARTLWDPSLAPDPVRS